jgi:hypothetical protein
MQMLERILPRQEKTKSEEEICDELHLQVGPSAGRWCRSRWCAWSPPASRYWCLPASCTGRGTVTVMVQNGGISWHRLYDPTAGWPQPPRHDCTKHLRPRSLAGASPPDSGAAPQASRQPRLPSPARMPSLGRSCCRSGWRSGGALALPAAPTVAPGRIPFPCDPNAAF